MGSGVETAAARKVWIRVKVVRASRPLRRTTWRERKYTPLPPLVGLQTADASVSVARSCRVTPRPDVQGDDVTAEQRADVQATIDFLREQSQWFYGRHDALTGDTYAQRADSLTLPLRERDALETALQQAKDDTHTGFGV